MAAEHVERLGARIAERRLELKDQRGDEFTQGAVARKVGDILGKTSISGTSVSRWERGEHRPSDDSLDALATVLETTVADLMSGPQADRPSATPDVMGNLNEADPLAAVRAQLDRMERLLTALASRLGVDVRDLEVESLVELVPGEEATSQPALESPLPAGAKTS